MTLAQMITKALAAMTGTTEGMSKYMVSASMSAAVTAFQQEIRKRKEYYKGEHSDNFQSYIRQMFSDANVREDLEHCFRPYNLMRVIVDSVSVVYMVQPERVLVDGNGEPVEGDEAELFEWLCKEMNLDCYLHTVNKYVSLCDTVLVRPFWYGGKMRLEMLTPDMFYAIEDPMCNTEAKAIYYWSLVMDYNGNAITTTYLYTADTVAVIAQSGDTTGSGYIPSMPPESYVDNPYGILPFARFVHEMPIDEYLSMSGSEMLDMQESLNAELSQLGHLIRMQSFSVPVLTGFDKRENEKITIGAGVPIVIGSQNKEDVPASFGFVSPSPKISDFIDYMKFRIDAYLYQVGLQASQFGDQTQNEASGRALSIKGERLMERRKSEIPFYEQAERDLFEVVKKIWNVHAHEVEGKFAGRLFSDDTHLQITIPDPKPVTDPLEERENWQWKFDNGIATPLDYLQSEGLSPEEAQAKYEANQKWRAENTGQMPSDKAATDNFDESPNPDEEQDNAGDNSPSTENPVNDR